MAAGPTSAGGAYEYNGQTYYFCSPHCRQKFQADPNRFLNKSSGTAKPSIEIEREPRTAAQTYTCPMHPEVKQEKTGSCPKCGMALEPVTITPPKEKIEYTCPMHPEIVRDAPGNCPICGMALEPRTISLAEEENQELEDMRRRFWVSAALTIPVFAIGMSDLIPDVPLQRLVSPTALAWLQLMLASPVVLWGGWPFFVRLWQSIVNRSPNMFTLIGLGIGVAYAYSVIATLFPNIFPHAFRAHGGAVPVYFEAAAVITTLVLLGQVLELKARSQTSAAIKALLGLAPKTARRIAQDGSEQDVPLDQVQVRRSVACTSW